MVACGGPQVHSASRLIGLLDAQGRERDVQIDRVTIVGIVAAGCPHAEEYLSARLPQMREILGGEGAQFILVDESNLPIASRASATEIQATVRQGTLVRYDRSAVLLKTYPLQYQGGLPTTLFIAANGHIVTRILGVAEEADYVRDLEMARKFKAGP